MTQKALLACAFLVACGSSADPSTSSSSTPVPQTPPTESPTQQPTEPTREGNVFVDTTELIEATGPAGFQVTAFASFGPKQDSTPAPEGCKLVDFGAPSDAKPFASDSAGTVDLGIVLGKDDNSLALEYDAAKKEYRALSLGAEGAASGAIHVHARGDVVPGFTADLPALAPVHIVAPAPGSSIGARDLSVSWTYDGEDVPAVVDLSTLSKHVSCLAGSKREIVVPASLASEVLAGNGELHLMVRTIRTSKIDAGDYRVSVSHNASSYVTLARE